MLPLRFTNSGIRAKALYRGGQLWPRPWLGRKVSSRPRLIRKEQRLPVASPQKGDAHKGTTYGHSARLPTRCRPRAVAPTVGAVANNIQHCHLSRGDDDDGRRKGATRVRFSIF
ncbi:hypothetical protein B296_00013767 [Ensete ventricosum]|uniref:Uncharacterized protein n=1 Tax=Ensete ventricosum TaxID=4639 RepID=A0A426XAQ2_ENSVE|nr:hypothetical protein B296_00013767 [Ensete ventricosum]